jgi:hypothetical protein
MPEQEGLGDQADRREIRRALRLLGGDARTRAAAMARLRCAPRHPAARVALRLLEAGDSAAAQLLLERALLVEVWAGAADALAVPGPAAPELPEPYAAADDEAASCSRAAGRGA